jgi:hypothetical protein
MISGSEIEKETIKLINRRYERVTDQTILPVYQKSPQDSKGTKRVQQGVGSDRRLRKIRAPTEVVADRSDTL